MKNKSKTWIYQTLILGVLLIVVSRCKESDTKLITPETGSYTDPRDGKIYKTVKIGDQWIMAENLAYKPDQGNFWAYDNDSGNVAIYGYLYDWETAKNVAPEGWHLPTRAEWIIFRKSLGGRNFTFNKAGGSSTTVYNKMVSGGSSGFNALFGGICYENGKKCMQLGELGDFWSYTDSNDGPWHCFVTIPHSSLGNKDGIAALKSYDNRLGGKSVRLFKD